METQSTGPSSTAETTFVAVDIVTDPKEISKIRLKMDNEIKLENSEDSASCCRICLRNLPNLYPITLEHKSKLLAVLKLKVLRKDPHQHICVNCSNLLDICLDFKNAAMQANILLTAGRRSLKCDNWNQPERLEAIKLCRHTVGNHRKNINAIFEEHNQIKNEESVVNVNVPDNSAEEAIKAEPICELLEESAINSDHANPSESLEEPEIEIRNHEDTAERNSDHSSREAMDDVDDEYIPSSSDDDVPLIQRKKSSKLEDDTTGGHRRRGRKPKDQPEFMPQLCDFCGKRVCGESAEGHKNQHLGIKPYPCTFAGCNLSFYGRYNRLRHVKRMHGETGVQVHNCHVCGKSIRGPIRALKYHIQRHEQNQRNEKNHVCPVCGKGFTLQRYLAQHSIVHSGEFPHKCSYCGKKFNNKWGMRTHEKNIHEKRKHVPLLQEQTGSATADLAIDASSDDV